MAKPRPGETVLATVTGRQMKGVVWKIEGKKVFIVADANWNTKLWTQISLDDVIEIDESVKIMTKQEMDHDLHGIQTEEEKAERLRNKN